jgi:hypothetical protein
MSSSSPVTVHRGYDPVQAEVLADVLREEGIAVRVRSNGMSAILGASALIESRIDVAGEDAARAGEVVAAFLAEPNAGDQALDDELGREPEPALSREVELPSRVVPMLAIGVAPLIPGGGHFVARRRVVGFAVLIGQICAIAGMSSSSRQQSTAAAALALGLLVFDVIGGWLAARAYNRGARASTTRQLVTALAALLGLGALASAAAPTLMKLRPPVRSWQPGDEAPGIRNGAPERLPFPLHLDF